MLPGSALLLSSSFLLFSPVLSGCNKDVLFNLRVSSLTEPGLYKQCYAVNRQARDAELRRLRGELRQHESKTAESFWQRSVAATRDKVRLETELDQAQAKASRTWFVSSRTLSRLAATLLCQKLSMVLLSFCLISPLKRRSSASRACLLTA